jgi:WD40 repeat protein
MPATNIEKLKSTKDFARKDIFLCIARMANGRLFAGSSEFKIYEIDLGAKPDAKEIGAHESYVTGVAVAGNAIVSGGYDGKLIWWDVDKKTAIRKIDAHQKWIRRVRTSPDGKLIASTADDMVCRVWDANSGKLVHELRGHAEQTPNSYPSMLYACAFSPDGKFLATGDKVGHIVVWDTATGAKVSTMEAPGMYTWDPVQRRHSIGGIRSLAFSPDGQALAVGGIGKIGNIDHLDAPARVEIFDWRAGKQTVELLGDAKFKGLVNQLWVQPQGEWLLGAGGANDGFLLFYDVKAKKTLRQEKAPMHIHDIVVSDNGDTIWAAGHGKIVIYELKA